MVSVSEQAPKNINTPYIIEINCHGGILTINRVLEVTINMVLEWLRPATSKRALFKWSY